MLYVGSVVGWVFGVCYVCCSGFGVLRFGCFLCLRVCWVWFSGFGLPVWFCVGWLVADGCAVGLVCRFCGVGGLFDLCGSWCFVGFCVVAFAGCLYIWSLMCLRFCAFGFGYDVVFGCCGWVDGWVG